MPLNRKSLIQNADLTSLVCVLIAITLTILYHPIVLYNTLWADYNVEVLFAYFPQ